MGVLVPQGGCRLLGEGLSLLRGRTCLQSGVEGSQLWGLVWAPWECVGGTNTGEGNSGSRTQSPSSTQAWSGANSGRVDCGERESEDATVQLTAPAHSTRLLPPTAGGTGSRKQEERVSAPTQAGQAEGCCP